MSTDYETSITEWHGKRFAHLTAGDGWLNVIGRFWLDDGSVTIGSAADNDLILPAGPAHLGTVTQEPALVLFEPADPAQASVSLVPNPASPPKFSFGSLRFEVTTMDGRNALRIRDIDAPERLNFPGLDYFATDPNWRITAEWSRLAAPEELGIDTVAGVATTVQVTHLAAFTHDGVRYELLPTHGTAEKPQFVIRDLTSRAETYGAARFVYGEDLTENSIVLDFNKAFNPPCAFTDHAVCPLPPPQNVLPFRIEAGEKRPN
ncbi:DUF1684 domain-containing protein [Devosia sp.]|uniref:DUF1684 domain-containing protein n=1 Tax=Devosia sp. TaxID=1871048 RepID=UPI003BAC2297